MALCFNVEDIVRLSQLSYKLGHTKTSAQIPPVWTAEELKGELFALHCALGHLSNVADSEAWSPSSRASTGLWKPKSWQSLDGLVADCAITLQDLERDINRSDTQAKAASFDSNSDCGSQHSAEEEIAVVEEPYLAVGESIIKTYRNRITSHSDAINVVLNAFHWSDASGGSKEGQEQIKLMQKFQENMVNSNLHLKSLVEEVLARLKVSSYTDGAPANQYGDATISGGYVHQGNVDGDMTINYYFANPGPASVMDVTHQSHSETHAQDRGTTSPPRMEHSRLSTVGNVRTIAAAAISSEPRHMHQRSLNLVQTPLMSVNQTAHPPAGATGNQAGLFNSPSAPTAEPQVPAYASPRILELNHQRHEIGLKALADLKKELKVKSIPSFMDPKILPSLQGLEQGLKHIFNPFTPQFGRQNFPEQQLRATMVTKWTQGLESLLQKHYHATVFTTADARPRIPERQTIYVGLLSSLNESLEGTNRELRTIFYDSSNMARIDAVFDKLLTLSRSVRVEKEVIEFQDERENFGWRS